MTYQERLLRAIPGGAHTYEINKQQVEEYRNNFPKIKDKRYCLYEYLLRENNQINSYEK